MSRGCRGVQKEDHHLCSDKERDKGLTKIRQDKLITRLKQDWKRRSSLKDMQALCVRNSEVQFSVRDEDWHLRPLISLRTQFVQRGVGSRRHGPNLEKLTHRIERSRQTDNHAGRCGREMSGKPCLAFMAVSHTLRWVVEIVVFQKWS